MDQAMNFCMYQPRNGLANIVQALWSVTVSSDTETDVNHWLQGDGGCGIIFNLKSVIQLDAKQLPLGCFLQPISDQAHNISLPPGSVIAGIRFHPAISYGLFKKHVSHPCALNTSDPLLLPLDLLHQQLNQHHSHSGRMLCLLKWLKSSFDVDDLRPKSLAQAIDNIDQQRSVSGLKADIPVSQRQLERHFQKWLGMSAKHYQRIVRTRNALSDFRSNPNTPLIELAQNHGFTDQAHMTREFKAIAKITPGQYRKKLVRDREFA